MSLQIDGVWNTDPDMDRLERQREAELDQRDCTGGEVPSPFPTAGLVVRAEDSRGAMSSAQRNAEMPQAPDALIVEMLA